MTAARRMKLEMTLKERGQRRKRAPTFDEQLAELTPNDRAEVKRFEAFLADHGQGVPLPQLIEKHGAAYLGFTEEEVAAIEAKAAEVRP